MPEDGQDPDADAQRGGRAARYGGAFRLKKELSSIETEDLTSLWRAAARIERLQEVLDDAADGAIAERPSKHVSKVTQDTKFGLAIEQASHMQCTQLWGQYNKCMDDKGEAKCKGWYSEYAS